MSIILALQPLLTAVIYSGLLKKKIFITQYIGLFLGLIGVLITIAHDLSVHNITYFGCILMLICLCSITVGSIIQKSNSEMDFRTGSTLQFAISVIPLFLLSLIFKEPKLPLDINFILSLSGLIFGVSIGATCLYYRLLRSNSAVKVNSLFYLMPAVTIVLYCVVFGKMIDLYSAIGIILTLVGVLITQRAEKINPSKDSRKLVRPMTF